MTTSDLSSIERNERIQDHLAERRKAAMRGELDETPNEPEVTPENP